MTGWEKFAGKTFKASGEKIGFGDTLLIVSDKLNQVKWEDVSTPSKPMVFAGLYPADGNRSS